MAVKLAEICKETTINTTDHPIPPPSGGSAGADGVSRFEFFKQECLSKYPDLATDVFMCDDEEELIELVKEEKEVDISGWWTAEASGSNQPSPNNTDNQEGVGVVMVSIDGERALCEQLPHCCDKVTYKGDERRGGLYTRIGETILTWAAKRGELPFVQYLLERCGCNVNFKDKRNKTALMKASEAGHLETVRYLIKNAAADTEIEDGQGLKALQCAALCRRQEVVALMIGELGVVPGPGDDLELSVIRSGNVFF